MKNLKKILASLTAVFMMLVCFGTVNVAAEETTTPPDKSVTVNSAIVGQTYEIYKLLDATYNSTTGAVAYTVNSAWTNFFNQTNTTTYVNIDAKGNVSWVENASVEDFAKLALAYASANQISAVNNSITPTTENPTVQWTGLDYGYYLVSSTAGALCHLDTTAPYAVITEKNTVPTVDKLVEEDSLTFDGVDKKVDDADIGQTVNYETTIKAYKGAENYVLTDVMDAGLTLNASVVT